MLYEGSIHEHVVTGLTQPGREVIGLKRGASIVLAACVIVLLVAGVAFADTNSGYLTPSGSPHGSYTTSSKKCGVCHAVHNATAAGELLMRDTVANACVYCHITNTTGLIRVYNGQTSNYVGDNKYAHNDTGAQCVNCHTPHGATNIIEDHAYLREKILKGKDAFVTPQSTDATDVAVAKWCTRCHNEVSNSNGTPYYETSYDTTATQGSHVMKAATDNYQNTKSTMTGNRVAWVDSTTCRGCHADGLVNQSDGTSKIVSSSFPHYTAGQRFLVTAPDASTTPTPAADSEYDGVCLRCHVSGTQGAGKTY